MRNKSPYFPLAVDPNCVLALPMEGNMDGHSLRYGSSLFFDDTDDKVLATAITGLEIASSFSFWMRPEDLPNLGGVVANSVDSNNRIAFHITNSKLRFGHYNGIAWKSTSSDTVLVNSRWYHIAGTFNGTIAKLYIDGVLQTGTGNPSSASAATLAIGVKTDSTEFWGGNINALKIWKRVLDQSEVTTLFGGGPVSTTNLTLAYSFDEATGSTLKDEVGSNDGIITGATWHRGFIKDHSQYNNDGELIGAPKFVNGVQGQGLEFDGVDDFVEVPDDNSLDFGVGDLSVSFWFKTSDIFQVAGFLLKEASAGEAWLLIRHGRAAPSNVIFFQVHEDGGNTFQVETGGLILNADRWYHCVCLINRLDGKGYIYFNGVRVREGAITGTPSVSSTKDLWLAKDSLAGTFWNGTMDRVFIFNRALTALEINNEYQQYRQS